MRPRRRDWLKYVIVGAMTAGICTPGNAFLFWNKHDKVDGAPAVGGETGITLPMPGANAKELMAGLVWTMRAGLNVAALQCQFAPSLRTVAIYNNMLHQHAAELQSNYGALQSYFKRTQGKKWATAMDQYTTKTYNGFSTLDAQLSFCETAASVGRETLEGSKGKLGEIATARMREFRASLVPRSDRFYAMNVAGMTVGAAQGLDVCYDKKGRPKKKCDWAQ
jgi:hypothetical protein